MASSARSIYASDSVEMSDAALSATGDKSTVTPRAEQDGVSGLSPGDSQTQPRSMPGAFPVSPPSPIVPSMPASVNPSMSSHLIASPLVLQDAALPKALQRTRGLVAEEARFSEASFVSLDTISTLRSRPLPPRPDDAEAKVDELSQSLEAGELLSIPASIEPIPTREPKIRIQFVRHAQAAHNIRNLLEGYSIQNPTLTNSGHAQCEFMLKSFPHMDKVTHVLCSPLMRTIETALEAFKPIFERGLKVILWPQIIEFGHGPTNRGDSVEELKKKMEGQPIDFTYLSDGWEKAANKFSDRYERVKRVAQTLHTFCQVATRRSEEATERLDVELLVISHGTFLRHLIRDRPRFANCQVRSCEFANREQRHAGASLYDLFETDESKRRPYDFDWSSLEGPMDGLSLSEEDGK